MQALKQGSIQAAADGFRNRGTGTSGLRGCGWPAAVPECYRLLRGALILHVQEGEVRRQGRRAQQRQRVRRSEGHKLKAQKLTVVVLRIYYRTPGIVPVNCVAVMCESMHGFGRRIAKKQQRGKPQRADDMKYPAKHLLQKYAVGSRHANDNPPAGKLVPG